MTPCKMKKKKICARFDRDALKGSGLTQQMDEECPPNKVVSRRCRVDEIAANPA